MYVCMTATRNMWSDKKAKVISCDLFTRANKEDNRKISNKQIKNQ